jgi:tRNA (cytidine/uridine-2'-O-)-methyltransferase
LASLTSDSPILNIVLHQPEIPGNTGAIGRTCVALGAKLWLVRPLGFRVDEKTLRRAGLDYWQHLNWEIADHWEDLIEKLKPERMWLFSRFATRSYTAVEYLWSDTLVFGSETAGLPPSLTSANVDHLLRIPTTDKVRSLNLATSVGVAAFEAARQIGL